MRNYKKNDLDNGVSEENFRAKKQICLAAHKEWQNYLYRHRKDIFLKVQNEK